RSRPEPTLRTSGGARLTVTRAVGQRSLDDSSAARTRSRASRHVASGRPTTVNPGNPDDTWTSTRTGRPSTPSSVADRTDASTAAAPPLRDPRIVRQTETRARGAPPPGGTRVGGGGGGPGAAPRQQCVTATLAYACDTQGTQN